jgi:hypothetical protein
MGWPRSEEAANADFPIEIEFWERPDWAEAEWRLEAVLRRKKLAWN